jgi:uncharacterized protein (DUF302 family)
MAYCFAKTLDCGYEEAVARVTDELKKEGFGVLTRIDVQATLKEKLGIAFRPYVILGACNPPLAHQALQAESRIGTMLPCNVIVQETPGGAEVAAIDPVASMAAVQNADLTAVAQQVRARLNKVIEAL